MVRQTTDDSGMSIRINAGGRAALALLALMPALALAGCGSDGEAAPQQAVQQQGRRGGGPAGARVVNVETAAVERGSIARQVTVTGVVEPIRSVGVNSQLSGAVLALGVEEGSIVRSGQVLARLDDREIAAQVASAEAEFNVREGTYQRAVRLRERQVITESEYERDRAAYQAGRAQLDQLRTRLGYATIRAPVGGVVTEKRVEAGDVVAPQTRIFTIGDISTIVVRVSVSELDVVQLRNGDRADVMLDAFPGQQFTGRIRRVFPSADPSTRLVPVEVALEGEGARLARPGFLARVTFPLGGSREAILVPASAMISDGSGDAVFTVEEGKAVRKSVERGLAWQGRVEVTQGLEVGEPVVVVGNNTLSDGMTVRVVGGPGAEVREPPAGRPGDGATAAGVAAAPEGANARRGAP